MNPTRLPISSLHGIVPDELLPLIGLVIVEHAYMDYQLQGAICVVGGMDRTTGISFMAEMPIAKRVEIFQNLARTREPDLTRLSKMLVLGDVVTDLSRDRNFIAHSVPYWSNPQKNEVGYFKEKVKTHPQIAVQPPYVATVDGLTKLAQDMQLVTKWLGMLTPIHLPDGLDLTGKTYGEALELLRTHGTCHPNWNDDTQFPWSDKLQKKILKESRKSQNRHRAQTADP